MGDVSSQPPQMTPEYRQVLRRDIERRVARWQTEGPYVPWDGQPTDRTTDRPAGHTIGGEIVDVGMLVTVVVETAAVRERSGRVLRRCGVTPFGAIGMAEGDPADAGWLVELEDGSTVWVVAAELRV